MKSKDKSYASKSSIKKSFRKSMKSSKSQERSLSFKSNNFVNIDIQPDESHNFDHLEIKSIIKKNPKVL